MLIWKNNQTNRRTLRSIINASKHFGWFISYDSDGAVPEMITIITSITLLFFDYDQALIDLLDDCKKPDIDDVNVTRITEMDSWEELFDCKYSDHDDLDDGIIRFNMPGYDQPFYFDSHLFLPILKNKTSKYHFTIRIFGNCHGAFIKDESNDLCGVILGYRR